MTSALRVSSLAGLGGGAARVVMSRSQPAEAGSAAPKDSAAEPSSSGEKRKAEADAQAALAKRRPLQEQEVALFAKIVAVDKTQTFGVG